MPSTRPALAVLAGLAALALAACAPGTLDPDASTAPPSDPAPTSSPAPPDPSPSDFSPAPSVPPTTDPVGGSLDIACTDVLTLDQVYELNPELLATPTPEGGVPAELQPYADDGVLCAWQHVTSRDVLLVGVLPADAGAPADLTTLPGRSAIAGDWLVAVASQYFEGADADAQALIDRVGGNLD